VTFGYLDRIPQRDAIRKRLTTLWDYRRTGLPVLTESSIWFSQNSGLQRQAPVYAQVDFSAKPTLAIDPNVLSPDGSVAMGQWSPSPNGRYLAYTRAAGGSVEDVYVRVSTGDLATSVRASSSPALRGPTTAQGSLLSIQGHERSADFATASQYHQVWYHRSTHDDDLPSSSV
jgi:prolyl oligopeptidase